MREWLNLLEEEDLSLLIIKGDEVLFKSAGHGIMPLLEAIRRVALGRLQGSSVVDRVVGKAGALLICYFSASSVYAKVMSKPAAEVLAGWGIEFEAESLVGMIKGRECTESCPFERAVMDVDDPKEGYRKLWALASSFQSQPARDSALRRPTDTSSST